nr:hypothetical protein [Streptococcus pyogenes]
MKFHTPLFRDNPSLSGGAKTTNFFSKRTCNHP